MNKINHQYCKTKIVESKCRINIVEMSMAIPICKTHTNCTKNHTHIKSGIGRVQIMVTNCWIYLKIRIIMEHLKEKFADTD